MMMVCVSVAWLLSKVVVVWVEVAAVFVLVWS
jgi:hypothetical protein